jgi:predicted dinucleotide-binding enzyme
MDVGIIGAGRLGQAMARTALRAGRSVVIANSRGPESLVSAVSAFGEGVSAGTVDEAASAGIVAANTIGAEVLGSDPHEAGGRRVIFVSGDDAKAEVVAVVEDAGFAAVDLGNLATGGAMQQIDRPLAGVNMIRL